MTLASNSLESRYEFYAPSRKMPVETKEYPDRFANPAVSSGIYRIREEEEGFFPDGTNMKEYVHHVHLEDPGGEMEDPDSMFEYKVYQDQSFYERSQKAKRIRKQQLEDWHRRESMNPDSHRDQGGLAQSGSLRRRQLMKKKKTVMFEWNVLLMDAVLRNEIVEVERLLSTYETLERCPRTELVNCRSPDGLTPLHQCCIENLEGMARLLIRNGADLRAADQELWTPLHAASTCGLRVMVQILLEAAKALAASQTDSMDIVRDMLLAVNSDGNMPFDLCDNEQTLSYIEHEMQLRGISQDDIESRRHKKEADMLRDLQQYVDNNLKNNTGSIQRRNSSMRDRNHLWDKFIAASKVPNSVMMHIAAANGYLDVLDLLIKHRYPVSLEDEDGWLPIHAAVAWNQPEAAKRLVEAGADITAKVRGTNETALDLAHAADLSTEDVQNEEKFRDQLIIWDSAHRAKCEEEAKRGRPELPRHSSTESVLSTNSPLMKRGTPSRVQRRSSLKDKEDLIALLQTLGAHDLQSAEDKQGNISMFTRSPGGSLRDRNPTLPNVPEEVVIATNVVHVGDVDLIDQTISPQLISSLLRSHENEDDDDADSVAESLMRNAEESLNQIDHPVTLAQLKRSRNRFRLLKRKEKPIIHRDLLKDGEVSRSETNGDGGQERKTTGLPLGGTSKAETILRHANGIANDTTVLNRYVATSDESPVGSGSPNVSKLQSKKRDKVSFGHFRQKDKSLATGSDGVEIRNSKNPIRLPPSNGCCTIS